MERRINPDYVSVFHRMPDAVCIINGSPDYPKIKGKMLFYQTKSGVVVRADINGLPYSDVRCKENVFGFHIHGGEACNGNEQDYFAEAGMHYNPENCPHPNHAGDLPPLFGVGGRAFSAFLTDRFTVKNVMGKTVIIHSKPDDFTTQPSGNAGEKIACGIIRLMRN